MLSNLGIHFCPHNIDSNTMRILKCHVFVKFLVLTLLLIALLNPDKDIYSGLESVMNSMSSSVLNSIAGSTVDSSRYRLQGTTSLFRRRFIPSRNLLLAELCSKSDISIVQGELHPLPNGIPTFSVQIVNLCPLRCAVTNIHVACGWFSSAKIINPRVFRRLTFNDCLVNDGNPLDGGDSVTFEYSNSFQYPMRIEAAALCRPQMN